MSILEDVRRASEISKYKERIKQKHHHISVILNIFGNKKGIVGQNDAYQIDSAILSQIELYMIDRASKGKEILRYIETEEPLLETNYIAWNMARFTCYIEEKRLVKKDGLILVIHQV